MPLHAQGPLISNALSTAFQFQMSVWHMIGEECICPVLAKHSDWCGLAGIVQAIVETFPKNCALMFPPPPPPSVASFSTTFRLQSSEDNDDDDADNYGAGSSFRRFDSSLLAPARRDLIRTGLPYMSTPFLHGGAFHLSTDPKEPPSSSLGTAPDNDEERGSQLGDDNLDMGQEADDEGDGEKDPAGDETLPDPSELKLLQEIIDPAAHNQPPPVPKSGDKRGPSHLDGGSASSDSSVEDLATKVPIKRVMLMCQCENGVNVKYSDSEGFGHPGTMGLWDLHSSDALNWAKMQLPSGSIDVNFCPCCMFYSTNNETLNNHVRKHYGMGLTCRSDRFTMASVAAMK